MSVTINIPDNARTTKKKGDKISLGDTLFEIQSIDAVVVNIAEKLHIKPDQVFQHLQKVIGEAVQKGELLAKKKGVLTTKKVTSPDSGIIRQVSHETGELIIEKATNKKSTLHKNTFQVVGVISDVNTKSVEIDVAGGQTIQAAIVTQDGAGALFYFSDEGLYFTIDSDSIQGKIVLIETLKPHIAAKCEALGCIGFICHTDADESIDLPTATISQDDYKKIVSAKKTHCIFSKSTKKILVYDVK